MQLELESDADSEEEALVLGSAEAAALGSAEADSAERSRRREKQAAQRGLAVEAGESNEANDESQGAGRERVRRSDELRRRQREPELTPLYHTACTHHRRCVAVVRRSTHASIVMSDITLSLGSKWRTATEEKEKQGQVIAHLTNQLEGLKSEHNRTHERVSKSRKLPLSIPSGLRTLTSLFLLRWLLRAADLRTGRMWSKSKRPKS